MTKGWTSPAMLEPSSDNPTINKYFRDLHEASLAHEKKEPPLPPVENGLGSNEKDAAANKAWSDWYQSRPQNDEGLKQKYGIGGKPTAGRMRAG